MNGSVDFGIEAFNMGDNAVPGVGIRMKVGDDDVRAVLSIQDACVLTSRLMGAIVHANERAELLKEPSSDK